MSSPQHCIACRSTMSLPVQRLHQKRNMIASLFAFITTVSTVSCQICETVVGNSWKGLADALDRSYGFAILCPFRISGEGCPKDNKSYDVKGTDLYAMCDSISQSSGELAACIIDCPGTHFTIFPGTSLTLDGMTLEGSKSSAVQVKPQGYLTIYNSIFSNNRRESGNGGAIDAAEGSDLSLMYSRFENCEALNGGAVYHLGAAVVSGSSFIDNHATNGGGGAIFSGSRATTALSENLFAGNSARFFAPALFDGSDAHSHQERNSACDNTIDRGDVKCDGIYSIQNGVGSCEAFDDECIAPTAAPTTATPSEVPSGSPTTEPSAQPSYRPTQAPTTSPTKPPTTRPSTSPSLRPSLRPTTSVMPSSEPSPSPSLRASNAPSAVISSNPSSQPTLEPSTDPTGSQMPSSVPTGAPSSSSAPSQSPSSTPSEERPSPLPSTMPSAGPSAQPSLSNSPTSSPTLEPSSAPSVAASDTPSSEPSAIPTTLEPSYLPSFSPSTTRTSMPSDEPTESPTKSPTVAPSDAPSPSPSKAPTPKPSAPPTRKPSQAPTPLPTPAPTPPVISNDSPAHRGGTYSYTFRTGRRRGPRR